MRWPEASEGARRAPTRLRRIGTGGGSRGRHLRDQPARDGGQAGAQRDFGPAAGTATQRSATRSCHGWLSAPSRPSPGCITFHPEVGTRAAESRRQEGSGSAFRPGSRTRALARKRASGTRMPRFEPASRKAERTPARRIRRLGRTPAETGQSSLSCRRAVEMGTGTSPSGAVYRADHPLAVPVRRTRGSFGRVSAARGSARRRPRRRARRRTEEASRTDQGQGQGPRYATKVAIAVRPASRHELPHRQGSRARQADCAPRSLLDDPGRQRDGGGGQDRVGDPCGAPAGRTLSRRPALHRPARSHAGPPAAHLGVGAGKALAGTRRRRGSDPQ